jgi:beta-lactamase regulating signal transducer with metallopeptidase domain
MTMFDTLTASTFALKTGLLIAAVGVVVLLTAKRSAAWRHFLWTSALALSLLMPIVVVSVPSSLQLTLPWPAPRSSALSAPALLTPGAHRAGAEPAVVAPRNSEPSSAELRTRTAWPTFMTVWLIGAWIVWLRNALAHVGLRRWARKARPGLSLAWAATLRRVGRDAGFGRHLRVLESDHATSPCTWGLVRPVVLLPAAGADWPESQRRFALLHELAHVRRLDYLTTQIASLACAVHWYNPLVWLAAAQARRLQEQACDDVVLNAGETPADYAQFLVGIAGARRLWLEIPAAVGMVQRSQLHGRVTAILDATRARVPLSRAALIIALAPLAGLMIGLAAVSAVASPVTLEPGRPLAVAFSAVELRNGGTVNLIHGPSQRVTLLKGDPEQIAITIGADGRLVIDRCPKDCPGRHDLEVEVETSGLATIAVAEGGTIQSRGEFPMQPEIRVGVSQGGTIDIRSMPVANVTASVYSGGRIFSQAGAALSAQVEQGGNVTYWGDPVVESSVRFGGVVVKGTATDVDRPLADLGIEGRPPEPPEPPIPPVPVVPAIEPISR